MVARGWWEKYVDMIREDFRSTEHANKTEMDELEQHCGELPDDQFAWVLFATLRHIVPTRDGSPWLAHKLSDISKFDMSPATKATQATRKSLTQQKNTAAVALACKTNSRGKANHAAAASLVENMVETIKHYIAWQCYLALCESPHWLELLVQVHQNIRVHAALNSQPGASEEGGDPVLGTSEVALSAVVAWIACAWRRCVSALEEKKDIVKVAPAFMESALTLESHHVKNLTTALKRMHPAVGKAVCVLCRCVNSQMDQFAESGGVPVLDVVKHVGAGMASLLPLGVMKLAALIYSLLPENDRTMGVDWLVSAHAACNVVQKIWVQIRRGIVGRGRTGLVREQLGNHQ